MSVGSLQSAVEGAAASQGGCTPLFQKEGVKRLENYEGTEWRKTLSRRANSRLKIHLSLHLAGCLGKKVGEVPQIDTVGGMPKTIKKTKTDLERDIATVR